MFLGDGGIMFIDYMHFQGQKFTWFRIREGEISKERLDRVLVNLEWMEEFLNMQVTNLPVMGQIIPLL